MNSRRPFDLAKLDFETIRRTKRRKLLLYSLPVCLVLLVICIKLLSIPLLSTVAYTSYEKSQYKPAAQWLLPLYAANWVEPYKLPFNHGNTLYKQGDFQAAEGRYRKALEYVPKQAECSVRINLALSIESQADALVANKAYDEAILRYDAMKAVLYDGEDSCGVRFNEVSAKDDTAKNGDESSEETTNTSTEGESSDGDTSEENSSSKEGSKSDNQSKNKQESNEEQAKNLMNRAQDKSAAAKRQRNGDETSEDSATDQNDSAGDSESTQEKLEKLENQSRNSQKERAKRSANRRSYSDYEKHDRSYKTKNW